MKSNKIEITTPFIKLDSLLKFAGIAETGGHGKELIEDGLILLDGAPCFQRGRKIYGGMTITYKGESFEVVSVEG